jgi:hypothetical protein
VMRKHRSGGKNEPNCGNCGDFHVQAPLVEQP